MSDPTWLTEEKAPSDAQPSPGPYTENRDGGEDDIRKQKTYIIVMQKILSMTNIALAALMCMASVFTLKNISVDNADQIDDIFLCLYNILFGGLLGAFEFAKVNAKSRAIFRKRFGFLVFPLTRAAFLLFVSLLQFGLDCPGNQEDVHDNWVGILTGCMLIFTAAVLTLLRFKFPEVVAVANERKALSASDSFRPNV